jgi:predicted 2-oxoglutarate/Fe(II)-dependent dioxygenase YbiX
MTNAMQFHASRAKDPIFTVPNLLSPKECAALIRHAEGQGFGEAPLTVGVNRFRMEKDVRNNERFMQDDPALAADLWKRLERHVPAVWGSMCAIGLNERFRYYRYTPGQYFRWHRDGAFVRSPTERSVFTVIFYLNDDFVGGTTDFYGEGELRIAPRQGMALVFAHPIYHQGAEVVRGAKYVLRSDVMYTRL